MTEVAYRLEPHGHGTRVTYEHTGFSGLGGLFMATLLGRVRAKMLTTGLPAVLNDMNHSVGDRQDLSWPDGHEPRGVLRPRDCRGR